MDYIIRKVRTKERFKEIVDSMRDPTCLWYEKSYIVTVYAINKNGVCRYEYEIPDKETLEEFRQWVK